LMSVEFFYKKFKLSVKKYVIENSSFTDLSVRWRGGGDG